MAENISDFFLTAAAWLMRGLSEALWQIKLVCVIILQMLSFSRYCLLSTDKCERKMKSPTKVSLPEIDNKWHLTDTNRTCQPQRVLSGLPALAMTGDCHSWCYTAKWEYNPLPGLFWLCHGLTRHDGKRGHVRESSLNNTQSFLQLSRKSVI